MSPLLKCPIFVLISAVTVLPNQMVLLLAFGLPKDMDSTSMDLRDKIVEPSASWKSSLQLVSTFEYDPSTSISSLLLSKARMEAFIKGGYEVGIINTATWKLQSVKVPCKLMQEVGDADSWDKSITIHANPSGRYLTDAQCDAWREHLPDKFPGLGQAPGCPTQ
jgi:hypothetical protein